MAQHTQGDWIVGDDRSILARQPDGTVRLLAEVFSAVGVAEGDANAHLIAAAPKLLEALKGLVPFCRESNMEGESDWERAWLKAEAAIAKATGAELPQQQPERVADPATAVRS